MVAVGGETVEIAGCKSAETAVSETCIGLALIDAVDGDAELAQHRLGLLDHLKVVKAGLEGSAHQELHGKVVNLLVSHGMGLDGEMPSLVFHNLNYYHCERLIDLLVGSLVGGSLKFRVKDIEELLLQFFGSYGLLCCFL